jgi:steroid delta-isomerase
MEGMDSYPSHPARDVSRQSMRGSEAGDRESWLALFADDAVIEDPIGVSSFDPEGKGHRGKDAIAKFWDDVISKQPVRFSIRASYAAGQECANVGTVTTDLGGGTKAIVEGVFTYRVDDHGRIAAMRAYWEQDKIRIETD